MFLLMVFIQMCQLLHVVLQGSFFGQLLFLVYINDLHVNECLQKLKKYLNLNLKILTNWLNANRISLHVSKTELVIFKPKRKHINFDLKLISNGKRLFLIKSVKYLGVKIDSKLTWKVHNNDIAIKLVKANAMLYKICDYVNHNTLKSIYFVLFKSHMNYISIIWGQNIFTTKKDFFTSKKALRTMHFKQHMAHSNPLFL